MFSDFEGNWTPPPPPIALECTIQHLVKLFIHSAFSTPNSKSLPFLYPLSLEDFG